MLAVRALQYVVVGARDLEAWEHFATAGLGLVTSARDDGSLYLRCDRAAARIIVQRSDNEDILALGWSVGSEAELKLFEAKFSAEGRPFERVLGEEAKARRALQLLRLRDGNEITHEIAWGIACDDHRPFISPIVADGFRSGELGLGHVVLSIDDLGKSARFFSETLGFKTSAHLCFAPGIEAIFMRCNRRHHSVALSESHRPKRLQHLQIEYNSMDDLGRALDRAEELPLEIVATLGKHVSDWVTSFYVRAPSGLVVELGYGARLLSDDAPTEYEIFTGPVWGHRNGIEKV